MSESKSDPVSGINLSGGNVSVSRDLVAGDVIQNIVIVGRFLEFSEVEGLLPKRNFPNFATIQQAFEATFTNAQRIDFVYALSKVRLILAPIFGEQNLSQIGIAYREIAQGLPMSLYSQLKQFGYWDEIADRNKAVERRHILIEEINLPSAGKLWEREFGKKANFVLTLTEFVHLNRGDAETPKSDHQEIRLVDLENPRHYPEQWTQKQFRVFTAGLIIDLLDVVSESQGNELYWKKFYELLINPK